MTLSSAVKTVGTTAVSLNPNSAGWSSYTKRRLADVTVQNPGANVLYIGGAGVTTSAYGYKVAAGGEKTFRTSDELWAIAAQAGNSVPVLVASVD